MLIKLSQQKLILPVYHVISDDDMPHIKHLYPVKGTKAFINDLEFLLKYYTPIDYETFVALAKKNKTPTKPSFLLSFDDGLREFYDIIAPILLKKGIPAICFLNSGFVDNKDLFYRYKASLLIDFIKKNAHLEDSIAGLLNGSHNTTQELLSVSYEKKKLLDAIALHVDYSFDNFISSKSPYLTTAQINALLDKGFHFGAHSIDHPAYRYLSLDQQIEQTKKSVQFVVEKFSLDYKIFSFPFTDYNVSVNFFEQINDKNIVDFTFGSAGLKNDIIPNNYQRIPLEMMNLPGRSIINSVQLYYLFKKIIKKNLIKRT